MSVTDKMTPEGIRFMKELKELARLEVFVGYQRGKKQSDDGHDLVDIAAWNELGAKKGRKGEIPPRPFLRQTFDKNQEKIAQAIGMSPQNLQNGATAQQIAGQLGALMEGLIQEEIPEGGFVPNAPITLEGGWMRTEGGKPFYVEPKKSDVPLIDTGQLRQSVHHVVRAKGSGEE